MSAASVEMATGVDAGIGTQAQIGAEDVAVGGALLQELHEPLREADEERRRLDVLRHAGDGRVEEARSGRCRSNS